MSQNGFDNGGISGVCKWAQLPDEVEFVLKSFGMTVMFFTTVSPPTVKVTSCAPAAALQRLKNNGAEVVYVTSPVDKWPGAMWRFLAINDPEAEYVIFRDAD